MTRQEFINKYNANQEFENDIDSLLQDERRRVVKALYDADLTIYNISCVHNEERIGKLLLALEDIL